MRRLKNFVQMTIGVILFSVAISLFLDPNGLVPGGVSGIAILIHKVTMVETGTLLLLLNVPILMIGAIKFGIKFIVTTVYCTITSSIFINYFALYPPVTSNPILAAISGATLIAVGLGWIFKAGATSGGTDIIVKLLKIKYPHMKTGYLFFVIDSIIVAFSIIVFGNLEAGLYAVLVVVIISQVMDLVLYGKDEAKMIFIISQKEDKISIRLLKELEIGVTILHGKGGFTREDKNIILCIVKKSMYYPLELVVKEEDPNAFLIVSSATEIYGEGYKSYFAPKI